MRRAALLAMAVLGIAVTFGGCVLIGALASNFAVKKFLQLTEAVFRRAPIVRLVYAALRDLLEAFVGDKKRFDQPVSVAITGDVHALGFVTQQVLPVGRASLGQAEQMREAGLERAALLGRLHDPGERLAQLRLRSLRGVVLGDPCTHPHHLGERPVRHAVAVGEAAAAVPAHLVR